MYKDYEIKLNAILDKHGVQKVELNKVKEVFDLFDSIDSHNNKYNSSIKKAKEETKKIISILTKTVKQSTELIKDAQELGAKEAVTKLKNLKKMSSGLLKDFKRDLSNLPSTF